MTTDTLTPAQLLAQALPQDYDALVAGQERQAPVHTNRASNLGHPCELYLVLERTKWEQRKPHDLGLLKVFRRGQLLEPVMQRDFLDMGWKVQGIQQAQFWKGPNISGHIDLRVSRNGGPLVLTELKTVSPNHFRELQTAEDLLNHKQHYVRAWPAQLQLYLLLNSEEEGLFVLHEIVSNEYRAIPFTLDYAMAESLLQKAERVNAHVDAGTEPEPLAEADVCERCPYFGTACYPPLIVQEGEFVDDPDLEGAMGRWLELKGSVSEYNELDKSIKARFKGVEKARCGPFSVTGKEISRKAYSVEASAYWKVEIVKG